jgi:hypothetical protein
MPKQWTTYFDTGGSETDSDGAVLITAGVVSTMEKWARFDRRWLAALASEGVRELHMRHLVPGRGEFDGWDEARKAALLSRLISEAKRGLHKIFVTAVVLPNYHAFNARYQLAETIGGPYALAQAACLKQAIDWLYQKKHGADRAGFFVAHGDNGQDRFLRFMKQEQAIVPEVARTTNELGETITPFQVADFIAWEYRRVYDRFLRTQEKVRARPTMEAIRHSLPVSVSTCGEEFFEAFCERHVPPRTA